MDARLRADPFVLQTTPGTGPANRDGPGRRVIQASRFDGWHTGRFEGGLVPPGRPGFIGGALIHGGISVLCGEGLARTVPETNSVIWGAAAGLVIGVINVGVIGRRFPAIAALPLVPQLADNLAFGALFAFVVDR